MALKINQFIPKLYSQYLLYIGLVYVLVSAEHAGLHIIAFKIPAGWRYWQGDFQSTCNLLLLPSALVQTFF